MEFFSRLFGSPKSAPTSEELQALKEENERKAVEIEILLFAHKILGDYGRVLADILDEGESKSPKIFLHPESVLPHPKDIIRTSFSILFGHLEKIGQEEWLGMSKSNLIITAEALEENFAPDEEIPNDPSLNLAALIKWRLKVNPEARRNHEIFKKILKRIQSFSKHLHLKYLKILKKMEDGKVGWNFWNLTEFSLGGETA